MLSTIVRKTKSQGSELSNNLRKLRKIYIDDKANRLETPFTSMSGDTTAYYERMISFILKYCNKKKSELGDKSLLYGYYDCQLPTAFCLMDYVLEWRSSIAEICNVFSSVSESFGDRAHCFTNLLENETFTDKIEYHVKYKTIFEMFLLRCIFDLETLIIHKKYMYNWANGYDIKYLYPPSYMYYLNNFVANSSVVIAKELQPLYDEACKKYQEFKDDRDSSNQDYQESSGPTTDIRRILMTY